MYTHIFENSKIYDVDMENEIVIFYARKNITSIYGYHYIFFSHILTYIRHAVDTYHWSLDRAAQKHTGFRTTFRFGRILISRPLIYSRR